MRATHWLWVGLCACAGGEDKVPAGGAPPAGAIPDSGNPSTEDSAAPTDSGPAHDTADTGSGHGTADTGGSGPCTLGLSVSVDATPVENHTTLHVGDAPSRAWNAVATVTLHNPCEDNLRFLGHPDDWMDGTAFSLAGFPPVYLAPGQSAALELAFTPGETGDYTGTFTLPYDQLGSPFAIELSGTATEPLTLVAVGEGRRVSTTHDYGSTFTTDQWDTLVGHTDAMQRGMCYGAGTFVSVGGSEGAHWWTSTDGDTWTAREAAGGAIGDCAFGDGQFVAFAGDLLTSSDGTDWSVSPQPWVSDHLRALVFGTDATGTGRWVAIGDNGRAAVTLDGLTWDADSNPISDSVRYLDYGIGAAGPVWVAVGSNGTIATSPDGVSWTDQVVGSADWAGVVWGGDRFLAGSGSTLYSSGDGYVWSLVGASSVVPIAHLGSMWFGTAGSALLQSTDDGLTWDTLREADGGPGYAAAEFAMETAP